MMYSQFILVLLMNCLYELDNGRMEVSIMFYLAQVLATQIHLWISVLFVTMTQLFFNTKLYFITEKNTYKIRRITTIYKQILYLTLFQ